MRLFFHNMNSTVRKRPTLVGTQAQDLSFRRVRHLIKLSQVLLLCVSMLLTGLAQALLYDNDPTFNIGTGADAQVNALVLQPDGKVLVGGAFSDFNGTALNRIARLNADGSVDTSFNPGAGADGDVYALALQPDGKILLGGFFTTVDGTARNHIARLNANGSLDTSFNPGAGADNFVLGLVLQPDGKVLLSGAFSSVDGTIRGQIARLNADGTLDINFDPGTGANGKYTWGLALQPDGKVLLGGGFSDFNGTARGNITRLMASLPNNLIVPDSASTAVNTPITVDVLANDTIDPAYTTVQIDLDPTTPGVQTTWTDSGKGTYTVVTVAGREQILFTPVTGFVGTSSANYVLVLTDSGGGSIISNPTTLTVVVSAAAVTTIPTLNTWTLAGLAMLLLSATLWQRKRPR